MCRKSQINYMECDGFFPLPLRYFVRDIKSVKWSIEQMRQQTHVYTRITIANDKSDRLYPYVTNTNSLRLFHQVYSNKTFTDNLFPFRFIFFYSNFFLCYESST